jgi:hypothetical protein
MPPIVMHDHQCLWQHRFIFWESLGGLSIWPWKKNLTSKFSYLFISKLTHKTKTGTANRWETANSKPPRPIIMIGQSKTGSTSQIIFVTLFFQQLLGFSVLITNLGKLQVKLACFEFLQPNLSGQGHILSTTGDSLIGGSIYDFRDPLCGIWCHLWHQRNAYVFGPCWLITLRKTI